MKTLCAGCVGILSALWMCSLAYGANPPAPSAVIPPREPLTAPQPVSPEQTIRRTIPTLDEEIQDALEQFRPAYQAAHAPRLLILFNRDMEDNDRESMVKTGKIQGGIVTESEGKNGKGRTKSEGGVSAYQRVGAGPETYDRQTIESLRHAFEAPFLAAPAKIADRDVAVRMHGLTEDAVFSYQDLPKAQRSQVAGVKQYADVLVTIRVERGTFTVPGGISDAAAAKTVELPNLVARAVRLSDARVLASATTEDVGLSCRTGLTEVATRVAMRLMSGLSDAWAPEPASKGK